MNLNDTVTCGNKTVFGITIKGCGWTGKRYDLVRVHFNTIDSDHPLSGSEGYEYKCPRCGKLYETETIRQS